MSKKNLYIFLIGLSIAGYSWLAWNVIDQTKHSSTLPICMFKELTGLPCPSCGTTRAIISLMQGNFRESLFINPFGIIAALALLIIPFWILADVLRNNDSFFRYYRKGESFFIRKRWLSFCAILVVMLNWFWNLSKGL